MYYNNIQFYNVEEMSEDPNGSGLILRRYPSYLSKNFGYGANIQGREKANIAAGVEIRFKTNEERATLSVMSVQSDCLAIIYRGDYSHSVVTLKKGVVENIVLYTHERFSHLNLNGDVKRRYSPNMWRIIFDYSSKISFIDLDVKDKLIPISNFDLPKMNFLAYGSSICQGVGSLLQNSSYIHMFANHKNVDVLNKALSGSCLCEKDLIDYIKHINTDGYIFEIGANMRGVMDETEFEKRVKYLLCTILENNKKIYVISILDFFISQADKVKIIPYEEKNISFCNILTKLITEINSPLITLIQGRDLASNITCLSQDLIHPSDYGHQIMGLNLCKFIKA